MLVAGAVVLLAGSVATAEPKVVSAWLDAKKVRVGERAQVVVQLTNDSAAPIGPVEIAIAPESLTDGVTASTAVTVPVGPVTQRTFEIRPRQLGVFNVGIVMTLDGRPLSMTDAGVLEVVEAPSGFAPYRDVVPIGAAVLALLGTLITLVVTVRKQTEILRETSRQKAADAVAQIVLQVARDYYGTIGGATSELANAMRRLHAGSSIDEREHLLVRCFFFFGTILHKDNEFSFSHGLLFLPDLWAEAEIRLMIDDLVELVPLTQAQEAVVHKCFSDLAVLQRGEAAPTVTLKARNLYEVETLLCDRSAHLQADQHRMQEVFDAVKERFTAPDALDVVVDVERAMRGIMEYEFTIMFSDFYRKEDARGGWTSRMRRWWQARQDVKKGVSPRDRPRVLATFDDIVRSPGWTETLQILERLEERRRSRGAAHGLI